MERLLNFCLTPSSIDAVDVVFRLAQDAIYSKKMLRRGNIGRCNVFTERALWYDMDKLLTQYIVQQGYYRIQCCVLSYRVIKARNKGGGVLITNASKRNTIISGDHSITRKPVTRYLGVMTGVNIYFKRHLDSACARMLPNIDFFCRRVSLYTLRHLGEALSCENNQRRVNLKYPLECVIA